MKHDQTINMGQMFEDQGMNYRIVATLTHDNREQTGKNKLRIKSHIEKFNAGRWSYFREGTMEEFKKYFPRYAAVAQWNGKESSNDSEKGFKEAIEEIGLEF